MLSPDNVGRVVGYGGVEHVVGILELVAWALLMGWKLVDDVRQFLGKLGED